jgi:hypothetical protein
MVPFSGRMKRVHVPELEDLRWFPSWLRACMTRLLVVFSRTIGVTPVLAGLVSRALKETDVPEVVDLGSGSGGVMPEVIDLVRNDPATANAHLTMTDLYPSPEAVAALERDDRPHLRYLSDPVDATDLASAPPGLKTMVNSFHHMAPDQARTILASAQATGQPLLVYELADNTVPFAVWCLLLPVGLGLVAIMALLLTPLVRPLTGRQLFFTYVVPIIPLAYAWDGQASLPRMYAQRDLDELLATLPPSDYRWEKGLARTASGRKLGTYLLGLPAPAGR